MSTDCLMLFCIKGSLWEPTSVRYTRTQKSFSMVKQQNLEKRAQVFREFSKIYAKNHFS